MPWPPASVDSAVPAVAANVPCALDCVLAQASERVQELAANLERFTATEWLEHVELDRGGKAQSAQTRTFNYLAAIHEFRRGMLAVEEYRNGDVSLELFPARLATMGLAAFALIFHPYFQNEFEMTCEGLGQWRGQPAWQIYFRSRLDQPTRFRGYKVGGRWYLVKLKGRAWISSETFQVLHLETDLLQPIPEIPLQLEHLAIEYRPVDFAQRKLQVWLPASAEVDMDYRGHRWHRRHVFGDFLLFSVDVTQQIQSPTQP